MKKVMYHPGTETIVQLEKEGDNLIGITNKVGDKLDLPENDLIDATEAQLTEWNVEEATEEVVDEPINSENA